MQQLAACGSIKEIADVMRANAHYIDSSYVPTVLGRTRQLYFQGADRRHAPKVCRFVEVVLQREANASLKRLIRFGDY